jgi:predicted DNA-binding transcriptional regulator YafY
MDALFRSEPLRISYHTPHKNETTERMILPLHLLCYMGSWHLIAFCTLKKELRDFTLSRIRAIGSSPMPVKIPDGLPHVMDYIRKNFGVMAGGESIEVCLKFSPKIANWVSEQVWHSGQEVFINQDGSICMKFPVADFKEVRWEILKYGANVEVLSPPELREEITNEIARMANVYK